MDPYTNKLLPDTLYVKRKAVTGAISAVMHGYVANRRLRLIVQPTRALRQGELIELIATSETGNPGEEVNAIAYIGFAEILSGGVILRGDPVQVNNRTIGTILGYDETHMPNHMNVVVTMEDKKTGTELDVSLDGALVIGEHKSERK